MHRLHRRRWRSSKLRSHRYRHAIDRVAITSPDEVSERRGGPAYVAEGPQILRKNGKIHVVYSAGASWTNDYTLGLLTFRSGDIMSREAWVKRGQGFAKTDEVFGPGHCSFTTSPDGKEDWIVYHAAKHRGSF